MLENCRPETKEALDTVLSCFGAEDGGISFYRFYLMMEQLDVQAQAGDVAAEELILIARRFARLIEVANKPGRELDSTTTRAERQAERPNATDR